PQPRYPLTRTIRASVRHEGVGLFSQLGQSTPICVLVLRALESERLAVPIGLRRQRGPDILEKGHDDILVLYRDRNVWLKDVPGVRCYGEVCGVELNPLPLSLRRGLRLLLRLRAAGDGRPAGAGQVGPRGPGSGAMPRGRLLEADRPERVGRRCAVAILVELDLPRDALVTVSGVRERGAKRGSVGIRAGCHERAHADLDRLLP